jgi:hypothetical protein
LIRSEFPKKSDFLARDMGSNLAGLKMMDTGLGVGRIRA